MIPAVLGLTAWIAKGVVLTALPRLLKAVTERCLPTLKTSPTPPVRLNQAVPQTRNRAIVYAYDNLSQLVGVNINQTPAASFQFDPAGNLLSLTVGNTTTAQTFNALNQKTTPGVNVYDAKGQTTDQDGRTFEWDDDGRMTAIVDGTHRSEFAYDGYGRRIKIAEFDNGNLTSKKLYWWLGGQIVCERDGIAPGFPLTKRYFGQGVVVGAERLYYTMDQLGSVRELVDSSGVVRADYRYSTYGERTKVGGDLDSDWGYAGLFHHGPSGLDLATYRTYDSKMGRWISRDPLGEGHDRTLYSYCGNSPINFSDPSGLAPFVDGSDTQVPLLPQAHARAIEMLDVRMNSGNFSAGDVELLRDIRAELQGSDLTYGVLEGGIFNGRHYWAVTAPAGVTTDALTRINPEASLLDLDELAELLVHEGGHKLQRNPQMQAKYPPSTNDREHPPSIFWLVNSEFPEPSQDCDYYKKRKKRRNLKNWWKS